MRRKRVQRGCHWNGLTGNFQAAWAPVPTQQIVQEIKSLYPADPVPAVAAQTPVSNLFLAQVAELIPNHTPTNAKTQQNLAPSECALNIGMTSETKLETVTCLCKLSPTLQQPLSRTQSCSTSHTLAKPTGVTDHSS